MANGFVGSAAEWDRQEAPLREIDDMLDEFASSHGISVTRNDRWPERSLRWENGVSRLIQIYLEDDQLLTWNLWLCAYQDRGSRRYWRREMLIKAQPMGELKQSLPALLLEGHRKLQSWAADDLEFATTLTGPV
jgi:hypothetical protein